MKKRLEYLYIPFLVICCAFTISCYGEATLIPESETIAPVDTSAYPSSSTQIPSYDATGTSTTPVIFAQPGENEVWLFDLGVNPEIIKVKIGATVTWTDFDTFPYTVTSDEGLFLSPILAWGSTWSFTFIDAGDYRYHISDDMNSLVGEVIVS